MSHELNKLAGDLQGVLMTASQHLTTMASAHAELLKQNETLNHELAAMKLARRMEQRGLSPELDFEAKVARLLDTPHAKFAAMEQAIELATGGFRLGSVQADDRLVQGEGGSSPDVLDAYISSQSAYT